MIAGCATDWDWIIVACPAPAYDVGGPFVDKGVLVGDGVGLLGGLEMRMMLDWEEIEVVD